ncbi:carbohydrate ABC transporter permease [Pelagicoccus sp. SDUM812002]|uniref:carbohydrate ABC transporter permease n=1 Tax=Pelagicoccus sp. SDUM812002 TaxID=3041266 RepID=UPI00280F63E7|nr:carbohydrate ABC transporter permease [Pelagicoccus sp. SDUM812002]MDQ8184947.1 carbohydrate ABC transporter permease [Pelagicoccus sp. SDUM812002]
MPTHQLNLFGKILLYTLLVLFAIQFAAPFAWMISTAFKPLEETMALPPVWIPSEWKWENFTQAIDSMGNFWRYAGNTLYVALLSVIGSVLSSSLAAYGFSRIDWPGRDKVFYLCIATMMIPFPVIMVPTYTLFRELDWIGTFKTLYVPFFLGNAFNIFLLRQFFLGIPKSITEAARIDGCSELRIFWQIILPLSKSALLVIALFTFMHSWNDFFAPFIFINDQENYTLALGLQAFQSRQGGTEWHYLMAASTLIILPLIVLFFFTQKTFIQGITATGAKG